MEFNATDNISFGLAILGKQKAEVILSSHITERGYMKYFLTNEGLPRFEYFTRVMMEKVAVPLTKGVIDFGEYGLYLPIGSSADPKAHWIKDIA